MGIDAGTEKQQKPARRVKHTPLQGYDGKLFLPGKETFFQGFGSGGRTNSLFFSRSFFSSELIFLEDLLKKHSFIEKRYFFLNKI